MSSSRPVHARTPDELRAALAGALAGLVVSELDTSVGELSISFGPDERAVTISHAPWRLTRDGRIVACSTGSDERAPLAALRAALRAGTAVSRVVVNPDTLGLRIEFANSLVLATLPDQLHERRASMRQWWYSTKASAWYVDTTGGVTEWRQGESAPPLDFASGRTPALAALLTRAVELLAAEGLAVIGDGRDFEGAADVFLTDRTRRYSLVAAERPGTPELRRLHAALTDPYSPGEGSRPVLAGRVVDTAVRKAVEALPGGRVLLLR